MKNIFIKAIVLILLCWMAVEANAQMNRKWTVGMKAGRAHTTIDQGNFGRIDETYSALNGWDLGLQANYAFTNWFAVRADFSATTRSYRMDRNLNYLDPVYTEYRNDYLMLPLMADFSFGGERLRGHAYAGGFGASWVTANIEGKTYWMTDYYVYFDDFKEKREFNSEDQRLIAGAVGGLGLSYALFGTNETEMSISLDALYYYDFVSHHKGYAHLNDPRYLNTLSLTLGILYSF